MIERVDVLIVGAGLSGIGTACHLRRRRPGTSFAVFEARERLGGTWDLFRYPGIRSDSDMSTLGYAFRPWTADTAIADGATILEYLRDTAQEYRVEDEIRYRHRVRSAEWSSSTARWTVVADRGDAGDQVTVTCRFLAVCTGYYRYDHGHRPVFAGAEDFTGPVVHPQHWPEDLEVAGRRVVVIGSGATAMTLVPELAGRGAVTTLLQRSPTFVATSPRVDPARVLLDRVLPRRWSAQLVRGRNILSSVLTYQLSRRFPGLVRGALRRTAISLLPAGFEVDRHFAPTYDPWDQRVCLVPDGDLFRAIGDGSATMVTDAVERFTTTGIQLRSGRHLPADIIVTATGLEVLACGGIELIVDGEPVRLPEKVAYRAMMLDGIPNFCFTVGYTNASWTLKSDLVANYLCRLLRYMEAHRFRTVTPTPPVIPVDRLRPLFELRSGYVLRGIGQMPRQGPTPPWRLHQNYLRDRPSMRFGRLTKGVRFGR